MFPDEVKKMGILNQIEASRVIAVLRGLRMDNAIDIANALYQGGITTLEITMETPKALKIIEKIRTELGEKVLVGAGTVLDPETARSAIMAGSAFVFSPTVNEKTIEMTKRYGVFSVPGAFSPTEVLSAVEAGADAVKIFPASVLGSRYLKDIKGPLPHIPLIPTGGIDLDNAHEFIQAGAVAVGVGGSLVNLKEETKSDFLKNITMKSKQFIQAIETEHVNN